MKVSLLTHSLPEGLDSDGPLHHLLPAVDDGLPGGPSVRPNPDQLPGSVPGVTVKDYAYIRISLKGQCHGGRTG